MLPWIYVDKELWSRIVNRHVTESFNIIYGYKCNYACVGCCNGSDQIDSRIYDPDLTTTLKAIEKLPDILHIPSGGMITLLGGEIFMYWEETIIPLVKSLRRIFPETSINLFSNGHLINKYTESLIDILNEYNCRLTISTHLKGDMSSPLGRAWKKNTDEFLSNTSLVKIHGEHYHVSVNTSANIYFYNGEDWMTWYQQLSNGKIKPWKTNDPVGSMKHGCASGSRCSSMFENRLYKCGSLAMLSGLLTSKKQLADPDWEKYLSYPYIDMLAPDETLLNNFNESYGKPIVQCDMCNNHSKYVIKWTERTQEMILPK